MIEKERFTITICDNYRHILKDRDSNLSITLGGMSLEAEVKLLDTLNNLHKENEELKEKADAMEKVLENIGYTVEYDNKEKRWKIE